MAGETAIAMLRDQLDQVVAERDALVSLVDSFREVAAAAAAASSSDAAARHLAEVVAATSGLPTASGSPTPLGMGTPL
jgi:hypothetical protein